jgi:hypothetical protein
LEVNDLPIIIPFAFAPPLNVTSALGAKISALFIHDPPENSTVFPPVIILPINPPPPLKSIFAFSAKRDPYILTPDSFNVSGLFGFHVNLND